MKFATLPFCAIAFAVLAIAQVALAHFELMTVEPVLLTVCAYSSLIAAGVWFDRRSTARAEVFAFGKTSIGMTSSLLHPMTSEWLRSLELTDENLANSGRLARLIRKQ